MDDDKKILNLLKTSRGQIDAVIKMVEDKKQCSDVLTQVLAVQGLIKKVNLMVIENHVDRCFKNTTSAEESKEKMEEIVDLLKKFVKS
jgi:DNA-binding FrmR family transcriptional regulator